MCVAGFNLSDFNLSMSVSVSEYFSIFNFFDFFDFSIRQWYIDYDNDFHDACFKLTSRRSTSSLKYLVQVDLLR
jgi:hypothetical protein